MAKRKKDSVYCGSCIVWPSICSFCWSRRYLVAIVVSDLRFVASVYLVGILWPLYCGQTIQKLQDTDEINRSFTSEIKQYIDHKIPMRWTEARNRRSDNTMATKYRRDKEKLQIKGRPLICSFCLSRRYLLAIVLSNLRFIASVYLVGILWPLYCLTFDL
jgi:hypothetical protein